MQCTDVLATRPDATGWRAVRSPDDWPLAYRVYRDAVAEALTACDSLVDAPPERLRLADVSLARGLAGLAVLADTIAAAPLDDDAERARLLRARCTRTLWRVLELTPSFEVSLFTGHTGLLWSLAHSEPQALPAVSAAAASTGAGLARMGSTAPMHFDLIFGAAGLLTLGRLVALRGGDATLARGVASWLLANQDAPGTWRTPTGKYRRDPPAVASDFYHDWGAAHGIPGALAPLVRFEFEDGRSSAAVGHLIRTWKTAERWLDLDRRCRDGIRPLLPIFSGARGIQYGNNAAWCYGDAGAGSVLVLAALAAGPCDGVGDWLDVVAGSLRRSLDEVDRMEPGICHGVAGLALIACRLYNATGQRRFGEFVVTLVDQAARAGVFGSDSMMREHGAGLLRGAAGVALALNAALMDREPGWDMVLCLS